MYDDSGKDFASFIKRHRLSAAANGLLIGIGIFFGVFFGFSGLIGLVGIAGGVGLEIWQRSRIPKVDEGTYTKRHRLSAAANGVLAGMGVLMVLYGGLIGIVGVVAGVGLEIWQRNRVSKELG